MSQYGGQGTMQWFGTYKDLASEYLKVKCRHRPPSCKRCGFDKFRGHRRVTIASLNKHLKLIASGCVSQSFEIIENRQKISTEHSVLCLDSTPTLALSHSPCFSNKISVCLSVL